MPDRQAAPPFVQARNFTLPDFHAVSVKNGIRAFIISGVQQDIIKVEMLFHAGRWVEQQPGISHFTSHLLEKGTKSKSPVQLAEAFDKLGAHIEISPGYDNVSISLYALRKNWKEAFSLMGEMILEPSFEEAELALMKSIFIQNLKVNLEKNSYVAGQLIRKNIFGSQHPYGSTIEEPDVLRIENNQLIEFYKQRFLPFAAFVTTHSSVSEEDIVRALSSFSTAARNASDTYPVAAGPMNQNQDKEDSVQKSLRMGKRTITRSHPQYADLALFNHILGGYFGSRLMKNIREEKGLTYGIYSSVNPLRLDSFLVIGADVNKDNLGLALAEIKKEINQLRTEKIDQEELEIAKSHFLGSLQLEVANPFSVMEKVKNMHVHNLPSDYYQRLFARISQITQQELMEAGEEHFGEEDLHVVTVG